MMVRIIKEKINRYSSSVEKKKKIIKNQIEKQIQ
jgi:hypothetical protein